MDGFYYIIVYPRGDRSKLSVAEIQYDMSYEENDYHKASRHDFDSAEKACKYGRQLAKENGLIWDYHGKEDYLD